MNGLISTFVNVLEKRGEVEKIREAAGQNNNVVEKVLVGVGAGVKGDDGGRKVLKEPVHLGFFTELLIKYFFPPDTDDALKQKVKNLWHTSGVEDTGLFISTSPKNFLKNPEYVNIMTAIEHIDVKC